MKKYRLIAALIPVALLAVVLVGVNVGAKKPGGGGPPSNCDGLPIEVYLEDLCGSNMWIQIEDSTTVCQVTCWMTTNKRKCPVRVFWIGGHVIADEMEPNGFKFDAATVRVAEVTEEGSQTTVCQIAANPGFYASPLRTWWVTATLTDHRPL
ncbi:MAG: hypothetical protein OEV49_05460 [candidate division Zixibacteria bacterium]|nr:hypothetical protein [candidate division Zixibacteria bacterium]MDH3938148.1 hypothetical protein [candidate division Zixibacteria bacterium]MDH4033045.1 hypothetical protein [candidate division Zixibacteria bacterium]